MAELLPSMLKALGSIPSTTKIKQKIGGCSRRPLSKIRVRSRGKVMMEHQRRSRSRTWAEHFMAGRKYLEFWPEATLTKAERCSEVVRNEVQLPHPSIRKGLESNQFMADLHPLPSELLRPLLDKL